MGSTVILEAHRRTKRFDAKRGFYPPLFGKPGQLQEGDCCNRKSALNTSGTDNFFRSFRQFVWFKCKPDHDMSVEKNHSGRFQSETGIVLYDVSNNAALSCQESEDFVFIGFNRDDLNNRLPVLRDHHRPTAFRDLLHHCEALRFELGGQRSSA